jgi:hypothetical protein
VEQPWTPSEPLFVDPASQKDPVIQVLEGLEKHIAGIPTDEPPPLRTPMLGARLCYRNALHLYKEGADLVAQGDVGTGRSLTILALEEFGKAWIYSMLEVGVFTADPEARGSRSYIDPRVFRCHRCKQGLVYAVEIGWSAMGLLGVFPTDAELGGDDATLEEAVGKLARHIERAAASPPAPEVVRAKLEAAPREVARITQLFADRNAMEDSKWEGFYVDFEPAIPTTPQKVTLTSYESLRGFVAKRLVMFSRYFLMELPDEDWVKVKATFAEMRLPVTELLCPRDPEAEHPTAPRKLAAGSRPDKRGLQRTSGESLPGT